MSETRLAPLQPLLVDDDGASAVLGVSRGHFLKMLASGRIDIVPVKLGRRRLYSVPSLRAWVEQGCKPAKR